jgi:uncharacterized small protein (DUF1192 family)
MSGRFTPAAPTFTSTSPLPGLGTGRSTSGSSSAPSGCGAAIACIVDGIELVTVGGLLTSLPLGSTIRQMDLDDLFPSTPGDPLIELKKQDLDPMSIEELHERIEALKEEIARVEAHIDRVQKHRSAADELFKK